MDAQCCGYTKKILNFTFYMDDLWTGALCVNKALLGLFVVVNGYWRTREGRPCKVPTDIKVFQGDRR